MSPQFIQVFGKQKTSMSLGMQVGHQVEKLKLNSCLLDRTESWIVLWWSYWVPKCQNISNTTFQNHTKSTKYLYLTFIIRDSDVTFYSFAT